MSLKEGISPLIILQKMHEALDAADILLIDRNDTVVVMKKYKRDRIPRVLSFLGRPGTTLYVHAKVGRGDGVIQRNWRDEGDRLCVGA